MKLEIAARLRRETTLSLKAISVRLHLGSSKAANRTLHAHRRRSWSEIAGPSEFGI
jgi:hypothetical protein